MAIEHDLYGEADLSDSEFVSFIATSVDGKIFDEGLIKARSMDVIAYRVSEDDEMSAADNFGFRPRVTATFRFHNLASSEERGLAQIVMYRTVLEFFERFSGRGVLLFNGEEVTIQKLGEEIEINSGWEEWTDNEALQSLINGYAFRPLPQPLL
ncbi:SitI3 family protein [Plantactinospora siamensis]|uniref:SitI3 family protein n=1 Tax=Plantactinospora siamensis TaxID=555372 RepID=A0ABV6NR76_9ACTN